MFSLEELTRALQGLQNAGIKVTIGVLYDAGQQTTVIMLDRQLNLEIGDKKCDTFIPPLPSKTT